MADPLEAHLDRGLSALGIAATAAQIDTLLAYLALIDKWNRVDNLTAIRSLPDMVTRHLLDSLSLLPRVSGRLLDVGSGAGLPGMPLAIMNPTLETVLLDASAKRTRFLHQVVSQLKLANVEIVQARLESYRPEQRFDRILSRAFASLDVFVADAEPLLNKGGQIIAMKGQRPTQELTALAQRFEYTIDAVEIPGLDAQRHLITVTKSHET